MHLNRSGISLSDGNRLDLDQRTRRQTLDSKASTGRRIPTEILSIDSIDFLEVRHICEQDSALDDFAEVTARSFDNVFQVLKDLASLRDNTTRYHGARLMIDAYATRYVHHAARLNGLTTEISMQK